MSVCPGHLAGAHRMAFERRSCRRVRIGFVASPAFWFSFIELSFLSFAYNSPRATSVEALSNKTAPVGAGRGFVRLRLHI